eukprot:TRINITY_DN11228_c0_g1_i11.p1 TRINITY_DN11228_c0_g1~~TRINITY_DN11228_c0_g1_i11.p1  ORF type:complete len:471 (+),score=73.33 TRINITY_DN11228_c0_g1_i11:2-1414(+)
MAAAKPALALAIMLVSVEAAAKPNILLLFPDQWRFDWDTLHSNLSLPLRMPFLQSIIQNGTRFTIPTFYRLLRDQGGYHVMVTGKDDLTKASQPGADGCRNFDELGFSDGIRYSGKMDVIDQWPYPHEPYGYMLRNHTVALENGTLVSAWDAHHGCMKNILEVCDATSFPDTLYEDDWTAENAVTLLERKPSNIPWFMQVNFPGPHSPFLVTARMHDAEAGRRYPPPVDNPNLNSTESCMATQEPSNGKRCDYAAELENLDRLFFVVVNAIPESERGNTLICVSSDHGEMLWDHGDIGKTLPWQGSASVPLICQGLDVKQGQTVSSLPVTTMDLAGTFLDYAGVPSDTNMTTMSLRPLLTATDSHAYRSHVSSGLQASNFGENGDDGGKGYNWRMVLKSINGTIYKYICCKGDCPGKPSTAPKATPDGYSRLLYNVEADPFDMAPIHNHDLKTALHPLLPAALKCPTPPS